MRWSIVGVLSVACVTDTTLEIKHANPEIQIVEPVTLSPIMEGEVLDFLAEGGDDKREESLQAEWYLDGEVICPLAPLDLDKRTACSIPFQDRDAQVRVSVFDDEGGGGSDFRDVRVIARLPPEVEISLPEMGDFYYENQPVLVMGSVSDPEDLAEDLVLEVSSDIQGELQAAPIAPDGAFQQGYNFVEGEHALTVRVIDSDGRSASDTHTFVVGPPNSAPTCAIINPPDGTAFLYGSLSNFVAEVDDIDIGPSAVIAEWSSDIDGMLGSVSPDSSGGVLFSRANLSRGAHIITMTAYDEQGSSCVDTVEILVGSAPSITMQAPADGMEFLEGETIDFAAQVSDIEQPADTLTLEWSSDVQGVLNSDSANAFGSTSFSHILDPGWHIITLTATDEVGLSSSETLSVLINQQPDTPSVSIIPTNPKTGTTISAIVSGVTDPDGQVPTVSYSWFKNGIPTPYSGASISSNYTAKGQIWRVEVVTNDGSLSSDMAFAETVIENSPPNIDSISISPSGSIYSNSLISCSATASDPDESVVVNYIWTNEDTGATLSTTASVQLQPSTVSPGDKLRCTAQTIDGEGFTDSAQTEIFVSNRSPILGSVSVSPVTTTTSETITCAITASDPDGQSLTYRYSWEHNGQVVSTASSLYLSPSWVQPGDVLTCTAYARDPYGAEVFSSANSTVINSGLIFTGVDIYPPQGVNNEGKLTCLITAYDPDGGTITKSYSWRNMSTGQSLGTTNPLQLSPSVAESGDIIRCTGTVVDNNGFYTQNTSVSVRNTPPSIDSVVITPSSPVYTSTSLTCSATYTDLDNEILTIEYEWMNVATGIVLGTGDTIPLNAYISKPGDAITCQAKVVDQGGQQATGAESVLVLNQPPTATWAEITPNQGYIDDIFVGYGYGVDNDNDPVSVRYSWYVDNVLYAVGTDRIGPGFPKGTKIVLEVTPTDGLQDGAPLNSNQLIVKNSKPQAPQIQLTPGEPVETLDDLVCRIVRGSYDADQDVIDYSFKWYRNGGLWTGSTATSVYSGDTIPGTLIKGWEEWRCEATPHDGFSNGSSVLSNTVQVRIICDPALGPSLQASGIDFNCIAQSGFMMGSNSAEPGRDMDEDMHPVALNQDFFISLTEITQEQFDSVMGYNPSQWLDCGTDCPVEGINWHMAAHFANKVSFLNDEEQCYSCSGTQEDVLCTVAVEPYLCTGYRLPTDAEWEFAARAGTTASFWTPLGGADLQETLVDSCMNTSELTDGTLPTAYGWFCTNHPVGNDPRTSPVAQLTPNDNGLYDMRGNVWEWCHDWYEESLGNTPVLNPWGPLTGNQKVVRGGAWNSRPYELRSAARRSFSDDYQAQSSGIIGIRLARTYFGQ